jgi:hypothetical protein
MVRDQRKALSDTMGKFFGEPFQDKIALGEVPPTPLEDSPRFFFGRS